MSVAPALHTLQALSAYRDVDNATVSVPSSSGSDFAGLLTRSLGSAVEAGQQAEAQATASLAGGGDVTSVVTAVSRAELALQTTVAVRDRVLQAYQDIIKMPI